VKTTLIDSPVANVANIARALRASGADLEISNDPSAIARSKRLVLPGVGSYVAAMRWLRSTTIDAAITESIASGAFLLGICVGHQALFDLSHEMGTTPGLGLVEGEVHSLAGSMAVPQIGWNRVQGAGRLFEGVENEAFYFVNSYAVRRAPNESASAEYNGNFTAAIEADRIFGVQFHPEKSSTAGLQVLRNFVACR
jgi:imidazole glycerol-phosphate synthase subunit HisH